MNYRRFVFFGSMAIVLASIAMARALAADVACPAVVGAVYRVSDHSDTSVYATTLSAPTVRTVAADLEIQTTNGWYALSIPETPITRPGNTHPRDQNQLLTSQPIYVRFPKNAGDALRWWVVDARSSGSDLSVPQMASTPCVPPSELGSSLDEDGAMIGVYERKAKVPADIRDPQATDAVLSASPGAPPQRLDCARPFAEPFATKISAPALEGDSLESLIGLDISALVVVSLGADGALEDAAIFRSSGNKTFDRAAIASARSGTFTAGTVFCTPAPGQVLIRFRL